MVLLCIHLPLSYRNKVLSLFERMDCCCVSIGTVFIDAFRPAGLYSSGRNAQHVTQPLLKAKMRLIASIWPSESKCSAQKYSIVLCASSGIAASIQ